MNNKKKLMVTLTFLNKKNKNIPDNFLRTNTNNEPKKKLLFFNI